ncbi:hypothetical protein EG871_12970 [Enterococcus faecium]|nr:hypothetical protein EG871_12970 [Enterococcus faecium]
MFLWLKTLYRKRAVTWPFIFYTIIWTLSKKMKNNKGSGKMDLEKTNNNSMIIKYQNTDNVLEDICSIR